MNDVEKFFVQTVEIFTPILNSCVRRDIISLMSSDFLIIQIHQCKIINISLSKKNDLFGGVNIYAKNRTPPRSFFGGVFVFWSGIFHTLVLRNHSYM